MLTGLHRGDWRPGDRLPTERALSETFAIGRTTVRRVLGELKDLALITQRVGSGTYVAERATMVLAALAADRPAASTTPAELMEARIAFEPALMALVIRRATPADFERMVHCCREAESATTVDDFEQWDGRLHEVIADATHNRFFSSVYRLMNHVRAQGRWGALKRRGLTRERRAACEREHRMLVEALMARDLARATRMAGAHLHHVLESLSG
ncbi:hypothetical protein ABE85_11655 [Mitsuaria sp. 7]|nr:hypothetical protein ABE85_11655 [Mitsuaria sp. 7]